MTGRKWTLGKIDIRAPVSPTAWPVARVEMEHFERGRMSDVATAPGELDAAFAAVGHIMGVAGRVRSLDLHYAAGDGDENTEVVVDISLAVGEEVFAGQARARDVLPGCVAAYIDAADAAVRDKQEEVKVG